MESIINHDYINSYAEAFTSRIADEYFSNHTTLDGDGILGITEIRQVNLFIIKNLMLKWQVEAQKFRSPFFNYDCDEVRHALQEFLNVLSRNILIEEKIFRPLLKMAVADTLLLIFSPYDYFSTELLNIGSPVTLPALDKRKKFIKVNGVLFNAFLNKLEETGSENLPIKEAKQYFDQVCEDINFSPEEPEEYIALFSKVIPFEIHKVYGEVDSQTSSADTNTQPEKTVTVDQKGKDEDKKVTVHEQFLEKKTTLIDQLKQGPSSTVLDYHHKRKIESIKKNISIQQRFRFVRELFEENDELFSETIDYLDNCPNHQDAHIYLNDRFLNPGKWNGEHEVVIEFLSVVKKKFPD